MDTKEKENISEQFKEKLTINDAEKAEENASSMLNAQETSELGNKPDKQTENQTNEPALVETDCVNFRRSVYLTIMSAVDFEVCANKLVQLVSRVEFENEVCNMVVECCLQEKKYLKFYGQLSQKICQLAEKYQQYFSNSFEKKYSEVHLYETNKLKNFAQFMSHLLHTSTIDWKVLQCITITQESTTPLAEFFLKFSSKILLRIWELTASIKGCKIQSATKRLKGYSLKITPRMSDSLSTSSL